MYDYIHQYRIFWNCSFQKIICRIHVSECWKSHKPVTSTVTSKCFNFCRIFSCFLSEWLPSYNPPSVPSLNGLDFTGRHNCHRVIFKLDQRMRVWHVEWFTVYSIKPIYTQRHYPYDVHAITSKICWCKKYLHVLSVYSANQWLCSIPIVYPFDMFRSAIWRRSAEKVIHTDQNWILNSLRNWRKKITRNKGIQLVGKVIPDLPLPFKLHQILSVDSHKNR